MTKVDYSLLTDEQLILEKRKLKNAKILHAVLIGFFSGVLLFGFTAWLINPEKKIGFLIPMLFPIWFIYKAVKNPKRNEGLEKVLIDRSL